MAGHEASHTDFIYDPVRLSPEGSLFNRIDLENIWDKDNGLANNPENGRHFHINEIQPQAEERLQLRQRLDLKKEYYPSQKKLLRWTVIQDYPFNILSDIHMVEYLNSLARWISDVISLPQDSSALWKTLNLLRLNCQYSDKNASIFRSVNGFQILIDALSQHFSANRQRIPGMDDNVFSSVDEDTLNSCREIVKLAEIIGFSIEDAVFLTETPSRADGFSEILHVVYFRGGYRKDIGRIVRITHAMINNPWLQNFDKFFYVIDSISMDPCTPSEDLSLCADVACRFCSEVFQMMAVTALCSSVKTLVSRFFDSDEMNAKRIRDRVRVRVNEEYSDPSAALERVLNVLCWLCSTYGAEAVNFLSSAGQIAVLTHLSRILKHVLLHQEPGAATFGGNHLLYALLIIIYIYESPAGPYRASPEDIKVFSDFAISALPTHYLFDGCPKLKDLVQKVLENLRDLQ